MCEILLKGGCDPDAVDSAKKTPLFYAMQGKHLDVMKLILRYHACPWSDGFCNY
jgi:ankyrin repeat protein